MATDSPELEVGGAFCTSFQGLSILRKCSFRLSPDECLRMAASLEVAAPWNS